MKMSFIMGRVPEEFSVVLSEGFDFYQSYLRKSGTDWPDSVTVTLKFDTGDDWEAEKVGPRLIWNVDEVDVQAVIDKGPKLARLVYVDGEARLPWAKGEVFIK